MKEAKKYQKESNSKGCPVLYTRLFTGILYDFLAFSAPIILPLSPQRYVFPTECRSEFRCLHASSGVPPETLLRGAHHGRAG